MPTRESEQGLGATVKEVAERASSLVRLELELATMEVKQKATALGLGVGFLLAAAVVGLFLVGFALATVAAALATAVALWLALLIVTGGLVLLAAILALLGLAKIRKGTPPVPEQAIEEAKRTTEALRSDDGR